MSAVALQEEKSATDERPCFGMAAARDRMIGFQVVPAEPWIDPDPVRTRWLHAVKDMLWPARAAGVRVRGLGEEDRIIDGRRVFTLHAEVGGARIKLEMEAP
jgi:hypothetical protein